jgi:hypothetical protein
MELAFVAQREEKGTKEDRGVSTTSEHDGPADGKAATT